MHALQADVNQRVKLDDFPNSTSNLQWPLGAAVDHITGLHSSRPGVTDESVCRAVHPTNQMHGVRVIILVGIVLPRASLAWIGDMLARVLYRYMHAASTIPILPIAAIFTLPDR